MSIAVSNVKTENEIIPIYLNYEVSWIQLHENTWFRRILYFMTTRFMTIPHDKIIWRNFYFQPVLSRDSDWL